EIERPIWQGPTAMPSLKPMHAGIPESGSAVGSSCPTIVSSVDVNVTPPPPTLPVCTLCQFAGAKGPVKSCVGAAWAGLDPIARTIAIADRTVYQCLLMLTPFVVR